MKDMLVRPESHEIDTLARKKVPLVFPSEWEHRELTGRDYGIDMIIEIFHEGTPTGNFLALQIKGTKSTIDNSMDEIYFDLKVTTLRYAEMFSSPVFLIICPVDDENDRVFYLWLQEYIRVILDFENPNWRSNKTTVRLSIPTDNIINKNLDKIRWISNYPRRVKDFIQFSLICVELEHDLYNFFDFDEIEEGGENSIKTLTRIIEHIKSMQELQSIFGDKNWNSPQTFLENTIIPCQKIAEKILRNEIEDRGKAKSKLIELFSVSNLIKYCNDNQHARIEWESFGSHNF